MLDESNEIAEMYNQFGRAYHESRIKQGRLFNEYLEMPATWNLIPQNLNNYTVLDAGCGSGIYARELANRGARVTAIDISQTMIDIAIAEKIPGTSITYQVGNLNQLPLADNAVDLIICNYVLENVKNIDEVFKEFSRVLKAEGLCIFTISHPLRAMADRVEQNNQEIWQLTNYYDRTTRISDFGKGLKIKKFKRTIADYINATITAGFKLTHFNEPQPILEGKNHDSKAYETSSRLPQLLLIGMKKDTVKIK